MRTLEARTGRRPSGWHVISLVATLVGAPLGGCLAADGQAAVAAAAVEGLDEGTPEAEAVLRVANEVDFDTLDRAVSAGGVGLDVRAARNITGHRAGTDGVEGTDDDQPFSTVAELDEVPWVGPAALEAMLVYARSRDWVEGGLCGGVVCEGLPFDVCRDPYTRIESEPACVDGACVIRETDVPCEYWQRCEEGECVDRGAVVSRQTEFPGGGPSDLAVEPSGVAHIVYVDVWGRKLVYRLVENGGVRHEAPIADFSHRRDTSVGAPDIELDADGTPHVTYTRGNIGPSVYYATRSEGGEWHTSRVAPSPSLSPSPSIAVDGEGGIHIAYHRQWPGNTTYAALEYAHLAPGASDWRTERATEGFGVGVGSSIALGDGGAVHVAHVDTHQDALLLSERRGGTWSTSVVDPALHPRQIAPALRVGPDGSRHVVYEREGNRLTYARQTTGGDWTRIDVDYAVSAAEHGLAVRPSGEVHLAYVDWDRKLVVRSIAPTGALGAKEPIDSMIGYGNDISIAYDARGWPHRLFVRADWPTPRIVYDYRMRRFSP